MSLDSDNVAFPEPKPDRDGSNREPPALHSRAIADLRFIRETMANAGSYTAFSGWGLMIVGVGALIAGWLASLRSFVVEPIAVWVADAGISIVIGAPLSFLKARAAGQPLSRRANQKILAELFRAGHSGWGGVDMEHDGLTGRGLPSRVMAAAIWGGINAPGTLSVWVIPTMGACFFCPWCFLTARAIGMGETYFSRRDSAAST